MIAKWNSREDHELNALGNPIAIELKSIRAMNSSMLRNFVHRAQVSGLKGVVLATTGTNDSRTKKLLARLRNDEGITAIALDRDDLAKVYASRSVVKPFQGKDSKVSLSGDLLMFDPAELTNRIALVDSAATSQDKGARFERLAIYLFEHLDGVEVRDPMPAWIQKKSI